tara:strand:- start:15 stop:1007 length:993 start_codon:yes stop_codon:yes gene_type:complete
MINNEQILDALTMFSILAVELSVLFLGISLLVGALQRHISPATIEARLSAKNRYSYLLAAALGAITPFCSCSTIPMLKGLIRARAGFGPMMVFLFASPLLNPIIVGLLVVTFGWSLTAIYVVASFVVSLLAGYLMQTLGFERYVISAPSEGQACAVDDSDSCCAPDDCCVSDSPPPSTPEPQSCCGGEASTETKAGKYSGLWKESWSDFRAVLPYLILGVAIGSLIYGFVPSSFLEEHAGPNNPFAIPFAAVIGVPLYIRAEAVIPLAAALLGKGVGAGAVLALIIGSAGASLTELILLRSLFTLELLAAFTAVIFAMAILAGYAAHFLY